MPPYWACAKTQPQAEAYAARNLEARGVTVFLPKIETRRSVQPLFASYIFCLVVDGHWLAIRTCYGVAGVIRFGDVPARVPDAEIAALQARMDANGVIRLPPEPPKRVWARGDRVKILGGQFASFDAIHSGMSNRAREIVLINMLGAQRQVAVAGHLIAAR